MVPNYSTVNHDWSGLIHSYSVMNTSVSGNSNPQVTLIPPGLARKRVWNKKYPISITLAGGEVVEETLVEGQREEEEERSERQRGQLVVDDQLPVTLYLFGRTGRDKEEWFQHFVSASRAGAKTSVSAEENTGRRIWQFTGQQVLFSSTYCTVFLSPPTGHCEAPSGGEPVRESVEELLDPPGGVKTRTLLDYSTYMTQLIGSDSCNPTPSPCQSDQESPTSHKKVNWTAVLFRYLIWWDSASWQRLVCILYMIHTLLLLCSRYFQSMWYKQMPHNIQRDWSIFHLTPIDKNWSISATVLRSAFSQDADSALILTRLNVSVQRYHVSPWSVSEEFCVAQHSGCGFEWCHQSLLLMF